MIYSIYTYDIYTIPIYRIKIQDICITYKCYGICISFIYIYDTNIPHIKYMILDYIYQKLT